ncbi:MAG: adenylate/guanylate cyclase domain-containing protein [Desulfuromonas sp.]|nr:adenylate/guanylate cyclase domain-containing protein [Desulfuromonas sp.]
MLDLSTLTARYRRNAALLGLSIVAMVTLCYALGLFSWLNLLCYDLHFKLRGPRPTSGQIVLVYMDEASAAGLHRQQSFWSRQDLAQAIGNLTRADSEIIALDMIFSAPAHNPQHDRRLAKAIADSNNIVLARISAVPGLGALEPLPVFQQGMIGDGFIDLPLDRDDCLRKIRFLNASPLANGQLQLIPAFALEVVRTYRNLDYTFDFSHPDYFSLGRADQKLLKLPYPELHINYYGTDDVFQKLSYIDVVNNQFDPRQVAGKIVLIGSSLKTEKDVFNTPFTRYRSQGHDFANQFGTTVANIQKAKEPGLACHAHAIETILNEHFIHPLSKTLSAVLILLAAAISQWRFYRQAPKRSATLCLLLLSAAIIGSSQWLFNHGHWLTAPPLLAAVWGQYLAGFSLQKVHERQRSEWIKGMFGKYVSTSIVDRLVQGTIAPDMGGQRQELTIFFADLRSFTSLAEQLDAHQTTQLLNHYFAAMIPQIQQQHGTLDKLIGDAILAFFGAPVSSAHHARQAANASLNMLSTLHHLKQQQSLPGLDQLEMGIGLNTGEVTIGNLGCDEFMDYTVIGDSVNLASRLEGLNKLYGTHILLSESTAAMLGDDFVVREIDRVIVKGKATPTTIYELMGFHDQLTSLQQQELELFAQALALYRQQQWSQAAQCFTQLRTLSPQDGPSQLFLQRIATRQHAPADPDWDGITRLTSK